MLAFAQRPPVTFAGHLDLLGEKDLLLPGQQRNFAHLRQIHPDRIVDSAAGVFARQLLRLFGRLLLHFRLGEAGFPLGQNLQADLFNPHEQSVELLRIDRFVRQIARNLCVRQEPLFLACGNELIEGFVKSVHGSLRRIAAYRGGWFE